MKNQAELQLWIAVHLLYPNSSQALDIYYQIQSSLNSKTAEVDAKILFLKLESTFSKNDTVRSGQPFRIFESSDLKNWKLLYKKCLKQPLLIIIGITIFNFTLSEVAEILKVNEEKARFLVNQAFKKLSTLQSVAQNWTDKKFKFKKIADQKISHFYTLENLVEFCLKTLPPAEQLQVEKGLALYPQLHPLQKIYANAIQELKNLQQSEEISIEPAPISNLEARNTNLISPFRLSNIRKSFYIAISFTFLFICFSAFRPISVNFFGYRSGPKSIKLNEVVSQPYAVNSAPETEPINQPVNLHEMPVASESKSAKNTEIPKISEVPKVAPTSQTAPPEIATKQKAKVKQGGLFRGTILVSDLDSATSRITEKLVALGGKKAGEVELGWRKSAHTSYYHLTLPEQDIQSAKEFLKNFGMLKLEFESHPRLMPAGIKRMILEVKEIE